jgi:hypothetical protein
MFNGITKKMAGRMIKKALIWLIAKTAPFWGAVFGVFFLAFLAYVLVWELPKQSILGIFEGKDRDSAYKYGGNVDEEENVFESYLTVAARWSEGLTEERLSQVEPYELDWAWLAALDRTLGDPEQSGMRDPNELKLDPEATFDLVRPKFEWIEVEKEIVRESCVEYKERDDEGNETTRYRTNTSTTYQPQILLKKAKTMQGVYVYSYRTETASTTSDSPCGQLTSTETYHVLSGITATQNDWQPLKAILRDQGIASEADQQFLLDYWLSFLSDPDGMEHDPLPDDWVPVEGELKWPAEGRISSQFGYRIHPITGDRKLHRGVDIAAPQGTEVYAAADGKVVHAGFLGNAGLAVILDHGDLETRYYHLSQVDVGKGTSVRRGDVIGLIGSTGDSTGPHLHFETRVGGEPIDPLFYFGEGLD